VSASRQTSIECRLLVLCDAMLSHTMHAEVSCMTRSDIGLLHAPNVTARARPHDASSPPQHSFARRPLRVQRDCILRQVLAASVLQRQSAIWLNSCAAAA